MSQYDYFVVIIGAIGGGILGMVVLFDLVEEIRNGK